MVIKKIAFIACVFVMVAASIAVAGALDEIKSRQKGLKTVTASFTQEKYTELFDRPIRSKGRFYLKSMAGVRWEYEGSMTLIYDGDVMYIHYIELEQAEKIKGASAFVGPLTFDIKALAKDYEVKAVNSKGRVEVELKPKKRMPFETMRMFFGPSSAFPDEIWTFEESGDKTVVRFSDVKSNVEIKDSMFSFTPPKGVRMVERKIE